MNRANNELTSTLFAMLGGIAGTLATTALVQLGVPLPVAAGGVAVAGTLAASSSHGPVQAAALGAVAGSAAQLLKHWYAAIERRLAPSHPEPVSEEPTAFPTGAEVDFTRRTPERPAPRARGAVSQTGDQHHEEIPR
jgi:hypothetical protein